MIPETLLALNLQFGVGLAIPDGTDNTFETKPEPSLNLKLSHDDLPVYAWASVGKGRLYTLGQRVSQGSSVSLGLGLAQPLTPKLSAFAEAGYRFLDYSHSDTIQQEVAFTYLVDRHHVHESRPIPVTVNGPYDQDSYETTFELSDSPLARVGLTWHLTDHLSVDASYRFHRIPLLIEIYDEERRANGGGWWMEKTHIRNNALEMRLNWEF
jgi:hypothetical protein